MKLHLLLNRTCLDEGELHEAAVIAAAVLDIGIEAVIHLVRAPCTVRFAVNGIAALSLEEAPSVLGGVAELLESSFPSVAAT